MLLMRSLDLELKYRRWRSVAMSSTNSHDNVNSPSHYNSGSIECIDAILASMSHEAGCGYLQGNAMKYLWRYRHKGMLEDLEKSIWYTEKLIEVIKEYENSK
jgi:hypothetical protein